MQGVLQQHYPTRAWGTTSRGPSDYQLQLQQHLKLLQQQAKPLLQLQQAQVLLQQKSQPNLQQPQPPLQTQPLRQQLHAAALATPQPLSQQLPPRAPHLRRSQSLRGADGGVAAARARPAEVETANPSSFATPPSPPSPPSRHRLRRESPARTHSGQQASCGAGNSEVGRPPPPTRSLGTSPGIGSPSPRPTVSSQKSWQASLRGEGQFPQFQSPQLAAPAAPAAVAVGPSIAWSPASPVPSHAASRANRRRALSPGAQPSCPSTPSTPSALTARTSRSRASLLGPTPGPCRRPSSVGSPRREVRPSCRTLPQQSDADLCSRGDYEQSVGSVFEPRPRPRPRQAASSPAATTQQASARSTPLRQSSCSCSPQQAAVSHVTSGQRSQSTRDSESWRERCRTGRSENEPCPADMEKVRPDRENGDWPCNSCGRQYVELSTAATPARSSSSSTGRARAKGSKLQRYTEAQKNTYERALREIQAGRKCTCWMWYVIPTPPHVVSGVERGSSINRKFALRSDDEARAFLTFESDGVNLRSNYLEIMQAVRDQLKAGRSAASLLGHFDEPKLGSSVQLFQRLTSDGSDRELNALLREVMQLLPTTTS
ncbi:unnamed protein product [Polarella glacialis]|uniref:Uncharacterized protein n=1 Tax=Polarella glacialis TaxID=89957 RepID=A0A813H1N7_POLGL|nr:unnamed protein product [Polarella glacialis]